MEERIDAVACADALGLGNVALGCHAGYHPCVSVSVDCRELSQGIKFRGELVCGDPGFPALPLLWENQDLGRANRVCTREALSGGKVEIHRGRGDFYVLNGARSL